MMPHSLLIECDTTLRNRFDAKWTPEPNTGCWLWTAARHRQGYGQIGVHGKHGWRIELAHRVAYTLYRGPIPGAFTLDHLCRVHECVNPEHLEPVTHGENIQRGDTGKASGMRQRAKTHCPQGHPYDEVNTLWQNGNRVCRECYRRWHREAMQRWRARRA